jgi:hypothetical protein
LKEDVKSFLRLFQKIEAINTKNPIVAKHIIKHTINISNKLAAISPLINLSKNSITGGTTNINIPTFNIIVSNTTIIIENIGIILASEEVF